MKLTLFIAMLFTAITAFAGATPTFDPSSIDKTVDPCQNFYQYACGNWIKNTQLPADKSAWTRSFSVIDEQNVTTLSTILSDYQKGKFSVKTPYEAKLGDLYNSCMATKTVEKVSSGLLAAQLLQVDALKDVNGLPKLVAQLQLEGVSTFFSFGPSADLKVPTLFIAEFDQGGYGLPDATYYTNADDDTVKLRQKYTAHMAKMFSLAGYNAAQAAAAADDVLAVENTLTKKALPPEKLQDPTTLYHPGDVNALKALVPGYDWSAYFSALGIATPKIINITEADFMHSVQEAVTTSSLSRLKSYLKIKVIEAAAPSMGEKLYAEWFDFNERTLNGQKEPAPRWKKCVNDVGSAMGEALGQAFVAKNFSPAAKERALALIANLHTAFSQDLTTLPWLDAATRKAALEKLELMSKKIGYPEKWRNYDTLNISRYGFYKNMVAATGFEVRRNLKKIGGQVDANEWFMTPQEVNAYYDPNTNSINFPAGILQSPFFSELAGNSNNYGGIGMVIGHEMTHGFDTTGSKFDGHGMQNDWWSPEVKKLFNDKAQCLINQYSQYSPLPGVHVKGDLTITENIADQGGLKLAFAAYKLATANLPPEEPIAGLNQDQQFFVSMAQDWCTKATDAYLKKLVSNNPHSPPEFRVIGTMVNSANFAKAFSCQPGTPMAPVNSCNIW